MQQIPQTYGPGGRLRGWAPIFVVLLSIPVIVVALHLLPDSKSNAVAMAAWGIMIGVGGSAAMVAILVSIRLSRAAHRRLADALRTEGFTAVLDPTDEQRAAVMEGMTPLALFESSGILHWHAWKKVDGVTLPAVVLQHAHVVGSGKYTREHFRTLVAWPLTRAKPEIWMRRPKAGLYRLEGTADAPDVQVGDEEFDQAFLVQCPADPQAPQRLLTMPIRRFILAGPKRESWVLARGYACCIFHADVDADGLRVMLRRACEMASIWSKA